MLPELKLIPITEKLPEPDQDVIAWNGEQLVAAKYVKTKRLSGNNLSEAEMIEVYEFRIEKYPSSMDRSIVAYWTDITHWMPAK